MKEFKIHEKTLLDKNYTFSYAFGVPKNCPNESYVKIKLRFKLGVGFYWSVQTMNISCSSVNTLLPSFRTLIETSAKIIEHENVGNMKYQILKEVLREKKIWQTQL